MAAVTMATAAGAAVLFYYVLSRRLLASSKGGEDREGEDDVDQNGECLKTSRRRRLSRRMSRRPLQAPATWFEVMTTLSETIRFTYSETLGKWPIGDLAFGLNYFMRRQANLQVASVYAGGNCVLLKGPEIIAELNCLLRYITLCNLFSKKPFLVFLESAGYTEADVLLQKPKAALLKPAFTILCDVNSKCLLLLIRGTHSIKDTLTAATGAVVPFHHSVLHDGGISNLVLGYAHCGMVAAARWIAKLSSPVLLKALEEYPDYKVKIVGHSLGGGTAALLTYILREQKEFSSVTCATFGPAACMTMDLAESGNDFITTVINGSDLVPTFSTASIDDLRSEVTASSWSNDLRDQVERTRVLNVVYRSATALGSRLPSIASARARVVGAGALLRPVSSSTQVVMKRAQNVAEAVVRTRSSLSSWSCMGARRRNVGTLPSPQEDNSSLITERSAPGSIVTEVNVLEKREYDSSNVGPIQDDTDEEEEKLEIVDSTDIATSNADEMTEGELWYELERELHRKDLETDLHLKEEEEEAEEAEAIQIAEEEIVLADAVESKTPISSSDVIENQHFYPPGKIMHMVSSIPSVLATDDDLGHDLTMTSEERVCIYETPRELYSKLRLTKTMINDHFMPMYQKTMKTLIRDLENEQVCDDCVM